MVHLNIFTIFTLQFTLHYMVNDLNFKTIDIRSINKDIANKLGIIAKNKSLRRSDFLKQEINKIIESEKAITENENNTIVNDTRLRVYSLNVKAIDKLTKIANHYGLPPDEYLKLKFAEIANNATPYELRNTDLEKE